MSNYPITAHVKPKNNPHNLDLAIPLPATPQDVRESLKLLKVKSLNDIVVVEAFDIPSSNDNLSDAISTALSSLRGTLSLDELNHLAIKINGLNDDELYIFGAALRAQISCSTVGEMINLIENFDCFDVQPACSEFDYGDFLVNVDQEITSEVFYRLQKSENPADRELTAYIERLEECVDKDAYGALAAKKENGVFTTFGYITQTVEELPTKYHGIEDIPQEHRLKKPSLMETLRCNRQKSQEQNGISPQSRDKGEPSL